MTEGSACSRMPQYSIALDFFRYYPIPRFLESRTTWVSTTNVEIELDGPTLVGPVKFALTNVDVTGHGTCVNNIAFICQLMDRTWSKAEVSIVSWDSDL